MSNLGLIVLLIINCPKDLTSNSDGVGFKLPTFWSFNKMLNLLSYSRSISCPNNLKHKNSTFTVTFSPKTVESTDLSCASAASLHSFCFFPVTVRKVTPLIWSLMNQQMMWRGTFEKEDKVQQVLDSAIGLMRGRESPTNRTNLAAGPPELMMLILLICLFFFKSSPVPLWSYCKLRSECNYVVACRRFTPPFIFQAI